MKKYEKYFFLSLFLLFSSLLSLKSQPAGEISSILTDGDSVNLSVCFAGDSLETVFIVRNTGTTSLSVSKVNPSFIIGQLVGHTDEFREFFERNSLPLTLQPNSSDTILIRYVASTNLFQYPPGLKACALRIGLFDPDEHPMPVDTNDLVKFKDFRVFARKSIHYLDAFDDSFDFDSVYVNPVLIPEKSWKIRNLASFPVAVDSQKLFMLSPVFGSPEFTLTIPEFPVIFPSKGNKAEWNISYYPKNTDTDSGLFTLYFKRNDIPGDIMDSIRLKITGTGVEQNLETIGYTLDIVKDTLNNGTPIEAFDFGDVRVGDSKELTVFLKNKGNIPFGTLSQRIFWAETGSLVTNTYFISQELTESGRYILPDKSDSFKIRFEPAEKGNFKIKFVLESDIFSRKISGMPPSLRYLTFYARGRAVEAKINSAADTMDFGNVVIAEDCPNSRDTLMRIANNGNITLEIRNVFIEPELPVSSFSVTGFDDKIQPNSTGYIKLRFSSASISESSAVLKIVSNSTAPSDTIIIYLVATGIPPLSAELSIPKSLESRPGTRIKVPIIVESNKISFARTFSDTLSFDRTILEYFGYDMNGTAVEDSPFIEINPVSGGGRLAISLSMTANNYFLPNDILIKLVFDTYLGEHISTPIAFGNPVFGDGICSKVLTIRKDTNGLYKNGLFSLDSICGLSDKIVTLPKLKYALGNISPNPAENSFDVDYTVALESEVSIIIYTAQGEPSIIFRNYRKEGQFTDTFSCSSLSPGIYYCVMKAGYFNSSKPLMIIK